MFSLGYNLLKKPKPTPNLMVSVVLAKSPCVCQIRSNQIVASAEYYEPFPFLINWKDVKDLISKITTKDTSL